MSVVLKILGLGDRSFENKLKKSLEKNLKTSLAASFAVKEKDVAVFFLATDSPSTGIPLVAEIIVDQDSFPRHKAREICKDVFDRLTAAPNPHIDVFIRISQFSCSGDNPERNLKYHVGDLAFGKEAAAIG